MQHSPVIQPGRKFDNAALISAILFAAILLVAAAALWLASRPAAGPPAPAAAIQTPAQANRIFADEAAYVATIDEYLNSGLDDAYLPLPAPAAAAQAAPQANRFFADELAGAPQAAPQTANPLVFEMITPLSGPR